jgi:hypothetical protein
MLPHPLLAAIVRGFLVEVAEPDMPAPAEMLLEVVPPAKA